LKTGPISFSQSQEDRERKTQHHLSRHLGGFVHRADGGAFPTEGRLEHRHVVLLTAANQNVA
jgi:hypothetical protein